MRMPALLIALLAAGLALLLVWTMLALPPPAVRLPALVAAHVPTSGVEHPVTAVLLNFRGYDTLLEVAVLLLALVGALTVSRPRSVRPATAHPLLQILARLLAPLMLVVATYLLWIGAYAPGGAFQAGAVVAAGAVLLRLAGLLPTRTSRPRLLRASVALGLLVFVAVALAALSQGSLLQYPPASAGGLIFLIESGLAVSIGLTLAGLYLATEARA